MSEKPWTDKETLKRLYNKYNTAKDVADDLGCSTSTVINWMDKYDIDRTNSHSNVRERDHEPTLNTICDWCSERFYKRPCNKEKFEHHFCSKECHGKWLSENNTGEKHWQYNRIEVKCENCDDTKIVPPSYVENSENTYCDSKCQAEYEGRSGHDNGRWKPKIRINCEQCDVGFDVHKSRYERKGNNFCSISCRADWMSENIVGENHHQYKGGTLYYGETWNRKRKKVQERDENVCQLCQKQPEQKPDVHHIKPVREFENPNEAHTMENMVQLCRSCHRKMEVKTEKEQRERIEIPERGTVSP